MNRAIALLERRGRTLNGLKRLMEVIASCAVSSSRQNTTGFVTRPPCNSTPPLVYYRLSQNVREGIDLMEHCLLTEVLQSGLSNRRVRSLISCPEVNEANGTGSPKDAGRQLSRA